MKLRSILLFVGFFIFCASASQAQSRKLTLEDAILYYQKGLYPKRPKGFQWLKGALMYSTTDDERTTLIFHPLEPGYKEYEIKASEIKPGMEKLPSIHWISASTFYFTLQDELFVYDTENRKLEKILDYPSDVAQNLDYTAKGKKLAYTIKNNLYIADKNNPKIPVAEVKDTNIVSGQAIARFEFGISKGTFWSPKGDLLAFYRKDETHVTNYPLVDITTYPASLKNIKYPMNGQGSELPSTWVYNTQTGKYLRLETKRDDHYLTNLKWADDEMFIYLAEVNRDQNHLWLNKYDSYSGALVRTLTEEQNEKWVEPEHPVFSTPLLPGRLFWMSERDGYMNIYMFSGNLKTPRKLTKNKWVIKDIVGYSQRMGEIIFTATGENPLNTHAFSLDIKSGVQRQITQGDGTHNVRLGGSNNEYLLDEYSSPTVPREIGYYDLLTKKYKKVFSAPDPLKDVRIGTTEVFTIKSYDGKDLYARMIKPSRFKAKKKYPVLVYVYGGPHVQLISNRWNYGAPLWMQWMAEQGYIIFTVDGHGSDNRGFDFESEVFRRLGTHEMEDQLIGVDYLKRLKYVDANRIAVHGWSFGGFMTTSLMLRHPGVFTTGVAGGPVIDWKWYEIMYGERYMDTEETNPEGFKEASLLNYVKNLKGHLLTIHGTVDDVVVPQHNYAFIKKCVDEGVQTDFFPYPMHPHNVRGKDRIHLMRKVLNYIMEHNQ